MRRLRDILSNSASGKALFWLRNTARMRRWVDEALRDPVAQPAKPPRTVLVPLIVWNDTDVPWFSLACGLLLRAAGHKVAFVVDDLPFGSKPVFRRFILSCLRYAAHGVKRHTLLTSLTDVRRAPMPAVPSLDRIRRLAELNALRDLRGEMIVARRAQKTARYEAQLQRATPAINEVLRKQDPDVVVLPGGIHASSGVWFDVARALGIRVATFDGGVAGTALWAVNGIACHFADVAKVLEQLTSQPGNERELDAAMSSAQKEIDARRAGTDKFAAQVSDQRARVGPTEPFVLIALNVSWDTQALDRDGCFGSISEFIVRSTRYVLKHSNHHIVIRQHPAERRSMTRSTEDYVGLLKDQFGEHPRIHFLSYQNPTNTYALAESARLVLVHTSTFGVEATMMRKPVITGSRPYYAALGATFAASDLSEYFALLDHGLDGELVVTGEMLRRARLIYYISQSNGWLTTPFNTGGFAQWSQMSAKALGGLLPQRLLIDSIANGVPISLQNHRQRAPESC